MDIPEGNMNKPIMVTVKFPEHTTAFTFNFKEFMEAVMVLWNAYTKLKPGEEFIIEAKPKLKDEETK